MGRAPVFCKSTLRIFSAINCYPFMILLIANILHFKVKAQWLIRACCHFHPNIERCYIPVDVADPPPRLRSPPLTLKWSEIDELCRVGLGALRLAWKRRQVCYMGVSYGRDELDYAGGATR